MNDQGIVCHRNSTPLVLPVGRPIGDVRGGNGAATVHEAKPDLIAHPCQKS